MIVRARMDAAARAREGDAALDSAFRRHWTWRTRAQVTVVGALAWCLLWVLYRTFRVRWTDPADVIARQARGERFVLASWHERLILLPLVIVRFPTRIRPRVLLSWHRDAEIAAQAARRFGVRFVRGSTTRGGLGDDLVIVPDGPRGPRREVQPGLEQLGRPTGAPIVPIALVAAPRRRLQSWDRMQVPFPFARVAIHFGAPVAVAADDADTLARVQTAMDAAVAEVERMLDGGDA